MVKSLAVLFAGPTNFLAEYLFQNSCFQECIFSVVVSLFGASFREFESPIEMLWKTRFWKSCSTIFQIHLRSRSFINICQKVSFDNVTEPLSLDAIMDVKMTCIFLLFSHEFPFNITVLQKITFGVFSDKDKHKQPLDVYRQKICSWKYSK